MQALEEPHLEFIHDILHYLRRYPSTRLYFVAEEDNYLQGSSNADYAQDADDQIYNIFL
jgi:hypothetical protein